MKLNFDVEKKKINAEANVEKLVEKIIDNHEKDWKGKFDAKHNAKKELLEIKHEQKIELEDSNRTKKNWIQKIQEEKRKLKEMELVEQRRLKELELKENKMQENKNLIIRIVISFALMLVGICFFVAGAISDPGLNIIGLCLLVIIAYIWLSYFKRK